MVDNDGKVVPIGKAGELLVSGYLLQKGCVRIGGISVVFWQSKILTLVVERYWKDERHTNEAMKRDENGTLWMHTGDEAVMDAEGYVRSE